MDLNMTAIQFHTLFQQYLRDARGLARTSQRAAEREVASYLPNLFPLCVRLLEAGKFLSHFRLCSETVVRAVFEWGSTSRFSITERFLHAFVDLLQRSMMCIHFVERIFGPQGITARQLKETAGCILKLRGRSSALQSFKRGINDGWEDDNDKPHIFLECEDAINRVFLRLSVCVTYVTKLLLPAHVWVDSVKNDQLAQLLSPINTTVFSQSSLENGANMAAAGVIGIMHTQHELQPMCAKNKAEIDVDAISGQWCNFWYYVWMKYVVLSNCLLPAEVHLACSGVSYDDIVVTLKLRFSDREIADFTGLADAF
uniref:Uncharacterized protein n=1 Tax=Parascaris equorum TaxID=6256 RepID=A0A914RSP5_PAREQ